VLEVVVAMDTIQQQVPAARVAVDQVTVDQDLPTKCLVEELVAVLTVQLILAVVLVVHKIQATVPIV
jgi:hypothetical protein